MRKKVSIVIPMYNSEKHIQNALESVKKQSYDNIEVTVVDDGSADGSLELVKKYARDNKRIKVYARKNHGVSATRNYGILKSTGDFVFFLDADDTIDSGVIEALIKKAADDVLVSCRIQFVEKDAKKPVLCKSVYSSDEFVKGSAENNNDIHGYSCGFLFDKKLCPSFNENIGYCEDILFLLGYILNNNIKKICYLDGKSGYYNYVQNIESATLSDKNVLKKIKSIALAMDELEALTDKKYSDFVEEKKMLLFKYEMSRATKADIVKILQEYELKKYTGKSLRCKIFSYSFRKKRLLLLLLQFRAKKILRRFI